MALRRSALGLLLIATAALVAAVPAAGKDGVKATLKTSIPLDAPAGTRLDVAWTLGFVDEAGRRRPFDAGYIFARLVSTSGLPGETVYARGDRGEYAATVVVPKGGIGDIQIGLVGWQSDATGTRRADALFPITNDPVPDARRVSSPAVTGPAAESGSGTPRWIVIVAGGLLLSVLAVALVRRKPFAAFALRDALGRRARV
jgi:hypothetical protein